MTKRKPFQVGDRVADREEPALLGTVVHLYEDAEIRDEVIVVKFDVGDHAVAVPIDTIKAAPISEQRRRPRTQAKGYKSCLRTPRR
jgi:hypothetical protein